MGETESVSVFRTFSNYVSEHGLKKTGTFDFDHFMVL